LARPDFRATIGRRLSEERELGPQVLSLLSAEMSSKTLGVRHIPLDRIVPNPDQPRTRFEQSALDELTASVREHGILQPVLVRPLETTNRYQLVAGERRWRAATAAGLATIPALIEELDDDTALEIAIIENLQREDLSPLEEAVMYDRMVKEHGYSIRRLAQKLGKDKGYLENRLRLADAPPEIQALVSVRKDTISHAYELLKVEDPRKRRRLAEQVAQGELTLVKLRERIEGRRRQRRVVAIEPPEEALEGVETAASAAPEPSAEPGSDRLALDGQSAWAGSSRPEPRAALSDDSLVNAKQQLTDALEELVAVLRAPDVIGSIQSIDRANLAKYLTIAKLRLENAIALVRSGEQD
jgi:ParB family transcriptional regulator, chromosome partitioning protein